MSEDPKLFEAGDYNLFRYCNNDPIDFSDPMGLDKAGPAPTSSMERLWEMTKWFDRSNLVQGNFPGFSLAMTQSDQDAKGVTVTGGVQGSPADPRILRNATKGEPNDRDAPNRLELGKVENKGYFRYRHLQLKHNESNLMGKGWAKERVTVMSRTLGMGFQPSGARFFKNGDVLDRVGPSERPPSDFSGDMVTYQTYRIYYGYPGEVHYYDIPQAFKQHTHIENGTVTAADVTPW